ncbi:DUF5916 domain-containing protein [Catalinimonas niigatensis]|uniref:DUF5916 domain-containing protein n=1 Tax=Catalinimonas niigatensis TaxID=1397264 RepID=UPI00266501D1|nr:DUF5916 domain-containing protein [Catalinimonas niigatensis]WPP49521.1 DUF5916 domain-containing protein [Catalinimonas niigatensis]
MSKILYALLYLSFILVGANVYANDAFPKDFFATRIQSAPKIDGVLDEEVWQHVLCPASGFTQRSPIPGKTPSAPTEVTVLYDNSSIYIGAILYDVSADSIMREFTSRDYTGFSDAFGVYFDTYDDDINAFEFVVSAAGVQLDQRWTAMGSDKSWNAGWLSAVSIDETNWYLEMEIPLSALRFPKTPIQQWGVNFRRVIRRKNEYNYWNKIDPQVNGFVNQFGRLSGVTNVKSPVRLSVSPYLSAYVDQYSGDTENPASLSKRINGGMDLRYGINDAFTLDMILVPDFGQVVSDNQVLNLSPFEVQFNENRQFFKEGTELFEKGGYFYSRRVGGKPLLYDNVEDLLGENEEILNNPNESSLINATKISGRTRKGLGLGIFNGLTREMHAVIKDTESGEVREVLTDPLTNYNVIAVDQSLKNNSYISFVNNHVLRQGHYYDANLTGTAFRFANKGNLYAVYGRGAVSQKYGFEDGSNEFGHSYSLSLAKTGGNLRTSITNYVENDTFDPNDLGYLSANNEWRTSTNLGYNIYNPFWKFLDLYTDLDIMYARLYKPFVFTGFDVAARISGNLTNFVNFSFNYKIAPTERFDYFEPRVEGRYVIKPSYNQLGFYLRSDNRNRFVIGSSVSYTDFDFEDQQSLYVSLSPSIRINNKLAFSSYVSLSNSQSNIGYAEHVENLITFGKRDINTINNIFNTKYTFNHKMGLTFRMRHYWSVAEYQEFYTLGQEGELLDSDYAENQDRNYNAFNIDMVYTYTFAPASEISIVWKNNIASDENFVRAGYMDNVKTLDNLPQSNSISVRVLYFIDYSMLMKKLSTDKSIG